MSSVAETIQSLNTVRWSRHTNIPQEIEDQIQQHLSRIATVVRSILDSQQCLLAEAHGIALTPAGESDEYESVLNAFADNLDLSEAGVREPILLILTANELWPSDPALSPFLNPWEPLVQVLMHGYPLSFVDSVDHDAVALRVGLRDGSVQRPVLV